MAINFSSGSQNRPALTRTGATAASGSSTHDFTSIPSDAKKITVWVYELKYGGSGIMIKLRIGDSEGFETTGYSGTTSYIHGNNNAQHYSDGIPMWSTSSGEPITGQVTIENVPGTNIWTFSGCGADPGHYSWVCGGYKTLSGTLDRVRIFNQGNSSFSAGQIWLTYET